MEKEKIRQIKLSSDYTSGNGMAIPKGTTLYVIKEGPKHPTLNHRVLLVKVDNGTGHLDLMPETTVQEIVKEV